MSPDHRGTLDIHEIRADQRAGAAARLVKPAYSGNFLAPVSQKWAILRGPACRVGLRRR